MWQDHCNGGTALKTPLSRAYTKGYYQAARLATRIALKPLIWPTIGILWAAPGGCFAQERPVGMVEPLRVEDFLGLSADMQSVYVGGIIEGTAFMVYGYIPSEYPGWVACVRRETLGETTQDVVDFIRRTPGFKEGVASAFAQMLGKRCKH